MTQRVGERLAFSLIADCAAMAAAGNHSLLSSLAPSVKAHIGRGFSLDATLVGPRTIEGLCRSYDECSCSAVRLLLASSLTMAFAQEGTVGSLLRP
jgi:hypothetical protein